VKEAIGTELNVLSHERCIHEHEVQQEHLTNEAFFNLDGTVNNLPDTDIPRRFKYVVVKYKGKITVKSFIVADELICKA
jgi:hypothetical protein